MLADLEERRGERITYERLAKQVGASKSSVAKWMTDAQKPEGPRLLRLAEVLETTPEFILMGTTSETRGTYEQDSTSIEGIPLQESRGQYRLGLEGGGNGSEAPTPDDQALFDEIRSILRDQDIPPGLKVLLIDAATSAWSKAALYRGEVASEERARAVHQAEKTQSARAEAIREVEEMATDRFRLLHPEAGTVTGAPTLPLKEPPKSVTRRRTEEERA